MIKHITGNLFESDAEAIVNTVNTVGVMGKGIALQFKKLFPENFKKYQKACDAEEVKTGHMFVTEEQTMWSGKKIIINFPTKKNWKHPSEYSFIESGLADLVNVIKEKRIKSVAVPPLGVGNGGLEWNKVKSLIEKHLGNLNCEVQVYQPNANIQETLKKERTRLTPARAMLLAVLYDMVKHGEFVSEFAAEKVAYFLQRFGAASKFNLQFNPYFYGPYSGKVKHVLYYLNGSYITGYSAKDKKPFEEIGLVPDAEQEVKKFLNKPENNEYLNITRQTINFLRGFYSPYGLELLSSIDFIIHVKNIKSTESIQNELENWSNRKKSLFTNSKFIQIATNHIKNQLIEI
ncbi:MAG: macro domain-containing protein [Marinilabilia sp.]